MAWLIKRKEYDESLAHAGVDGMHWGDRRYQYKSGKYTPLGKEHYAKLREQRNKEQKTQSTVPGYDPSLTGTSQSALASRWNATRSATRTNDGSMFSEYENSKKRIQELGLKDVKVNDQIEYECYDDNGKVQRYTVSFMEFLKNPDLNKDDYAANIISVTGKDGTSRYKSEPKLKDRTFAKQVDRTQVQALNRERIDDETVEKLRNAASVAASKVKRRG